MNQCVIEGLAVANFTIGTCATSPRFATNFATSNIWGRLAIFNKGQLLGVQTDHYKNVKLLSPHVPQEAAFDIIGNIIKRTTNVLMKSFNATNRNSIPLLSEPKL